MSLRDSMGPAGPGNTGAGGLGNGGIGGGMGGGSWGGGYGGGMTQNTGLGTGNVMYGNTAYGRPGGMASAYGMNGIQQPSYQGVVSQTLNRPTHPAPPQVMPGLTPPAPTTPPAVAPPQQPMGIMSFLRSVFPNTQAPPMAQPTGYPQYDMLKSPAVRSDILHNGYAPAVPKAYPDRAPSYHQSGDSYYGR